MMTIFLACVSFFTGATASAILPRAYQPHSTKAASLPTRGLSRSRLRRNADRVEVEVLLLGVDAQDVLAGCESHAGLAQPGVGAPPSGARHGHRAGDVGAVDLDVEAAGGEFAADVGLDRVRGGRRHVDGVLEPLAGLDVVDHVARGVGTGCR